MTARAKTIVGFCTSPRLLGTAVVTGGSSALLRTVRLRGMTAHEERRLHEWVRTFLRRYRAGLVVLAEPVRPEDGSVHALLELVREAASASNVTVVETSRAELARMLGIRSATNAALRRHIVARDPVVAAHVGRSLRYGFRSEAERYWELAAVAACTAVAAFHELA